MTDTTTEAYLQDSLRGRIIREFFGNSAHFPIILILLELLLSGAQVYLSEPDVYALLLAASLQAYWIGIREFQGRPAPLWGNLIAPSLYTLAEVLLEWGEAGLLDSASGFFQAPHHQAFWLFALSIGASQSLRRHIRSTYLAGGLIIVENLARTLILAVMYFVYESIAHPEDNHTLYTFTHDGSHIFIVLSLVFIGLLLGVAHLSAETSLARLRATSRQLHVYSSWLLGKQLLASAVREPGSLTLQRRERAVLFMDIRGFTAWSEAQSPEQVVAMLNGYFEAAEQCWSHDSEFSQVIKVKHTGDEVMIVFGTSQAALATAYCLREAIGAFLAPYRLGAGIGLHSGPLVEGLLGSREVRGYDIIGDTVNTAKRICDHAARDEILLSRALCAHLQESPPGEVREVSVKGKSEALQLLAVQNF